MQPQDVLLCLLRLLNSVCYRCHRFDGNLELLYKIVTVNFLDTPKAHLPPPDTEQNNAVGVPASLIEMQLTSSTWIHHR